MTAMTIQLKTLIAAVAASVALVVVYALEVVARRSLVADSVETVLCICVATAWIGWIGVCGSERQSRIMSVAVAQLAAQIEERFDAVTRRIDELESALSAEMAETVEQAGQLEADAARIDVLRQIQPRSGDRPFPQSVRG